MIQYLVRIDFVASYFQLYVPLDSLLFQVVQAQVVADVVALVVVVAEPKVVVAGEQGDYPQT